MPPRAPSSQTLRVLSRLCSREQPHLRGSNQTSSLSRQCQRLTPSGQSSIRIRPATTLHKAPGSPKTNQNTVDPQIASSADQHLPDISNYYTLFPQTLPNGPPRPAAALSQTDNPQPEFYINARQLRSEFLKLQSLYHPDKYPSGSAAHQKAYALSTLLNNAYKTLADPLLRAQYLLQLHYGIDVTSEDNSAHPTDQDTLMEVMQAQEQVEDATSQEEVDVLRDENMKRIRHTETKMGEAFEKDDIAMAKDECVRLKYWVSLQQGLDDWEPGKEVRLIH